MAIGHQLAIGFFWRIPRVTTRVTQFVLGFCSSKWYPGKWTWWLGYYQYVSHCHVRYVWYICTQKKLSQIRISDWNNWTGTRKQMQVYPEGYNPKLEMQLLLKLQFAPPEAKKYQSNMSGFPKMSTMLKSVYMCHIIYNTPQSLTISHAYIHNMSIFYCSSFCICLPLCSPMWDHVLCVLQETNRLEAAQALRGRL